MLILAVDTSGPSCGVALLKDELLCYEATANNRLTHSVNLMPMVEEAFTKSGCSMDEVDLFACVSGPGSFTGVRIGVAAVKGMAMGLSKPCIAVNALEALALGVAGEGVVCPIRDARVHQVYGGAFHQGKRLMEDNVWKLNDYLHELKPHGEKFLFVGDGVRAYKEDIVNVFGERAKFAPPHLNDLKAGAAAMIAFNNQAHAHSHQELKPLYLRAPQAERERQKKDNHG